MEMGGSSSVMELSSLKTVKRTRDNNPTEHLDGQQKKPKLTPSQLKLVAINDDCLEAIFDYLELMDLINVAESHSRFKFPAQWVYSHQYSMKKVILSLVKTVTNAAHSIDIDEQMALPLFRHFGNLISKLSINFMGQQAQTIEKSLLTNYADSLTELELILCHRDHFDNLSRPLENIEKLKISKSLLGKKLSQLSIWFPNIVELELIQVEFTHPKSFESHFDQLKSLVIRHNEDLIESSTINEMLRLNRQLETLVLQIELDFEFVQSIGEHLTELETLEVWAPIDRFYSFGDDKICFENVKNFTLNTQFEWGEFLVNVPFELPNLKQLKFDGFNEFKGQIINFVKQNRDLEELCLVSNLEAWDDLDHHDLDDIMVALPKLKEIEFCADFFTASQIVTFLESNKSLQHVKLWFIEPPIDFQFRSELEKTWNLTTRAIELGCCCVVTYFSLELRRKD